MTRVDTIVKNIQKLVNKLEKTQVAYINAATREHDISYTAIAKAKQHQAEADRAQRVRDKLISIIE